MQRLPCSVSSFFNEVYYVRWHGVVIFEIVVLPSFVFDLVQNGSTLWNNARESTIKSELPPPIPRNTVESDHGCTSRIYFGNAGNNVTLTLYNVTLTSQKPC